MTATANPLPDDAVGRLLAELAAQGVQLWLEDGQLRFRAPREALTPGQRHLINAHRAEVIHRLVVGVARVDRNCDLPLSDTQQRLWFNQQLDPASAAYHIHTTARIRGPLDVAAAESALAGLVARHESFRTRFSAREGVPHCRIDASAVLPLERADVSTMPEGERLGAAIRHVTSFVKKPFDLTCCPLARALVVALGAHDNVLCFVLHHIVADGVSKELFLRDFSALYAEAAGAGPAALAPIRMQYADFAEWQRQRLAAGDLDEQVGYWTRHLAGLPDLLQLPTDRPRPALRAQRGARVLHLLPLPLVDALRNLGRAQGATLFMTLMAGFQTLLYRYTGSTDIAVGTAVANRPREDLRDVIGFFANNLVIRGDFSGQPTVRETLGRIRQVALDAYAHADMPFDLLVEKLAPPRRLSHTPLFQVLFVLQGRPFQPPVTAAAQIEYLDVEADIARFDLAVDAVERADGISLSFEYSCDLFDAATIQAMVAHYVRLLEGFVAVPQEQVARLPILTPLEVAQLDRERVATRVPPPASTTVQALIGLQAAHRPDAPAIRHGDTVLTYGELEARSSALARGLRARGVQSGQLVGIWLERNADLVVALLGTLKAGAAYVPLDPIYPRERVAYILEDAGVTTVLTHRTLLPRLPDGVASAVCLDEAEALGGNAESLPSGSPTDLAYVIYTSGSTGRPKGVEITQGALVNLLTSMQREPGLTADAVLVAVTTVSFDIAALEIFGPLTAGGLVVVAPAEVAGDGRRLAALLAEVHATVLQATPATWRMLCESGWAGRPGLRMLCGGEALPQDLAARLLTLGSELWNLYGPTETTIWSTVARVTDATLPVDIGRPIANTTAYVIDAANQLAPRGVLGELCLGGASLARGYHARPELTAERFVRLDLPDGHRERVYRTGDLARVRADGRLECCGRRDHQVKIRGFRIELGEIETRLLAQGAVQDAVVVTRDAAPGDTRLVAYVVYQSDAELTVSEVRRHLRNDLPDYMIPSLVVALDALPRTPNGKTDRAALPDPFARSTPAAVTVPPESPMEQLLADLWSDVLNRQGVGAEDNFFDLGGHSLLTLRVTAALEQRTGWRMDPRMLFFSTLRQIAAAAALEGAVATPR